MEYSIYNSPCPLLKRGGGKRVKNTFLGVCRMKKIH